MPLDNQIAMATILIIDLGKCNSVLWRYGGERPQGQKSKAPSFGWGLLRRVWSVEYHLLEQGWMAPSPSLEVCARLINRANHSCVLTFWLDEHGGHGGGQHGTM